MLLTNTLFKSPTIAVRIFPTIVMPASVILPLKAGTKTISTKNVIPATSGGIAIVGVVNKDPAAITLDKYPLTKGIDAGIAR